MPRLADVMVALADIAQMQRACVNYKVEANNGDIYWFFAASANNDLTYCKSTDGGLTWSADLVVVAGTVLYVSVWFDRWSGIAAGLIHIAYTDSVSNDTLYRTLDTENADALSTETVIFAGATATGDGALSIARSRGGNVYCRTTIDAGVEGGFFRLPNANVPNGAWDAARTINEALATQDQFILVPGFAADNQDMMLIFWDASANEVSRQIYDDSANSWAETSISTGMVDVPASTIPFRPHFSATVDLTNSRILLAAWNGVDTANADLLCWTVTESAITAKTDVVTNGTDDQGGCAFELDTSTGFWWVFYAGKSDGSETWHTAINVYYKVSTDAGATWGPESQLTSGVKLPQSSFVGLDSCPRFARWRNFSPVHQWDSNNTDVVCRVSCNLPQAGVMHQAVSG